MMDPSTTRSSDEGPEPPAPPPFQPDPAAGTEPATGDAAEADTGDGTQRKLKLRQILTPISPHLTAPRPERDPRLAQKERSEPIPQAVPIDPEPEPPPPEQAPAAEAPAQVQAQAPVPPTAVEEAADGEPDDTEDEEEKPVQPAVPARMSLGKRLLLIAVPVVLLAAILLLLNILFEPFGSSLEPIQAPAVTQPAGAAATPKAKEADAIFVDPQTLSKDLGNLQIGPYLDKLRARSLHLSGNPPGLFVDSVFFPYGAAVNPQLGLVLVNSEATDSGTEIVLQDAGGAEYRIPLP